MNRRRWVGIGAAVAGVLVLFSSCGHNDSQPPIKVPDAYITAPARTQTTTATTPTNTPTARLVAPMTTSRARSTRYTPPPVVDVDVPDVPHVKRDRNGRCHDEHGRFTRCLVR